MPQPMFKDIPAYKAYAAFSSRPNSISVWPKNGQGKFVIESGELMCRYEVNGGLCPNTARFKSRQELNKHIKEHHELEKTVSAGGKVALKQYDHLVAYYERLVEIMRRDPLGAPVVHVHAPLEVNANVAQNNNREEGADIQSEDEDDAGAPVATPRPPAVAPPNRGRSYGISEGPLSKSQEPALSNNPPSRLPKSMQKTGLYDDWDPEVLRKAKEENSKLIKMATSESGERTVDGLISRAQADQRR